MTDYILIQEYLPDLFKEIALHPLVWPMISDDGCSKDFEFPASNLYLVAMRDGEAIGFFMLSTINSICVEVHTIFHPKSFGDVTGYAKALIDWVFSYTKFEKMITYVPFDNPKAKRLAERAGMSVEGVISDSYKREGKLLSQYILGAGKCQQSPQS